MTVEQQRRDQDPVRMPITIESITNAATAEIGSEWSRLRKQFEIVLSTEDNEDWKQRVALKTSLIIERANMEQLAITDWPVIITKYQLGLNSKTAEQAKRTFLLDCKRLLANQSTAISDKFPPLRAVLREKYKKATAFVSLVMPNPRITVKSFFMHVRNLALEFLAQFVEFSHEEHKKALSASLRKLINPEKSDRAYQHLRQFVDSLNEYGNKAFDIFRRRLFDVSHVKAENAMVDQAQEYLINSGFPEDNAKKALTIIKEWSVGFKETEDKEKEKDH